MNVRIRTEGEGARPRGAEGIVRGPGPGLGPGEGRAHGAGSPHRAAGARDREEAQRP